MSEIIGKRLSIIRRPFGGTRLLEGWSTSHWHAQPTGLRKPGVEMPTFQALDKGTTWSMSRSLAAVQVAPSYGETHFPLLAEQLSS
jgi:hypothetical protein